MNVWEIPPPDFTDAPVRRRVRIGPHVFQVAVSRVQRSVPGEPDTHLVQAAIMLDGRPLAASDLGLRTPDGCSTAWAYLTNRLTETIVQFYTPSPRATGEMNPRLGCWGPRPDLVREGFGESDCAIAAIVGASIWMPGARPPVDEEVFLEAIRDTLIEAVSYWVLLAQRSGVSPERRN